MSCKGLVLAGAWVFLALLASTPPVLARLGIPKFLQLGKCAKFQFQEDYDPVKYSGLWFDIESVPNEYQHTKQCITQNYHWEGDHMSVATRGLSSTGQKVRQGAVMRVEKALVATPHPAYMTVEATGVPAAPYQIIETDYRTYSCVYSCLEYFGFRAEFAWVFARTPTLPKPTIQRCHDKFATMKVNYTKMIPITQGEACPYYEKIDEMLNESQEHMLKVLGPVPSEPAVRVLNQPTAAPTTPTTTTTPTTRGTTTEKTTPFRTTKKTTPNYSNARPSGEESGVLNNPSKELSNNNPSSRGKSVSTVEDQSDQDLSPAAVPTWSSASLILTLLAALALR